MERKVTLEVKQCIQNEVASLSDTITSLGCKDDETLTCSKLVASYHAQTNELHCQSDTHNLHGGHEWLHSLSQQ